MPFRRQYISAINPILTQAPINQSETRSAARPADHRDSIAARSAEQRDSIAARSADHRDSFAARSADHRDSIAARPADHRDSIAARSADQRELTMPPVQPIDGNAKRNNFPAATGKQPVGNQ